MHSCAWMNGQRQQVGPASQAITQLAYDTMRNQHTGTANNLCQYRTVNTGVQPPQNAKFTFQDGANRQMSNWQTSAAPHQAVSFQQPAGGKNNSYYCKVSQQNSNTQTGNHCLPVNNGFQVATQHSFHHSSAPNSSTQSPPSMMKANNMYTQQNMSPYWNQPVHGKQSIRAQDSSIVSDFQHYRVQKTLHQNVNGESIKPISAYTTTATSLLQEQAVCTTTLMSAPAHNRQTIHNQRHTQNGLQQGLPPSSLPNNMGILQSFRNNRNTTNSLSSGDILHVSSISQNTQQYAPQLNPTHNTGGEATSSVNSYNKQSKISRFLSKINEIPFNPNAAQEQMIICKIARIVDSLQMSYPTGSDGHRPLDTSLSYRGQQFVSEVRMMESNQTMQPVTSAQTYNSNTTQFLPLHSGQSLPKTTSVMSRAQHIANVQPQQSSVADGFRVTATGDGSGNTADNALSKGNVVGSSSNESHLMQMLESISPQRNKTQSFVANSHEMLEILKMPPSAKKNDSSIHSSPGRTGAKAVAVVQPLSQESYQVASKHSSSNTIRPLGECTTTEESFSNPDKLCISPAAAENWKAAYLREGFNVCTENENQLKSNKFAVRHSAASTDSTAVSSSTSSGPQDLSQKQLCADEAGSELTMQADQQVATAPEQSETSEVPVSQISDMDKNEIPTELSSVPTKPWTNAMLTNLIQDEEKAQMELEDCTAFDPANKLLSMFWGGNYKMLASKIKTGWYKDLITDVKEFCDKQVTTDSIVLSQVKHGFRTLLKNNHVLKDNEVYSELIYKSPWLNVNDQVDDIDKEFGFPWSLRHRLDTLESDSQPERAGTGNSIHAQNVSEVPNNVFQQTEVVPVDSGEEKRTSTFAATSTQTTSPIKTESADSRDPYYSFEIQVLPPEEAKVIFEQVQSKMPQSMDMDSQPEEVMNSSVEDELHDVTDVTLRESKLGKEPVSSIEQVCCIARWMEIIGGSNTTSLSKCQCKTEQSQKNCTDKTLDKEKTAAQKTDKLLSYKSDTKFYSETKEENQGNDGESIDSHIMTFSSPELCNKLSKSTDLNEDDNKSHLNFDKEPKNISMLSINDSQSSIIVISDSEDEDHANSENKIPTQMSDFGIQMADDEEEQCVRDQLKSAGNSPSRNSDSSEKEKIFSSEVANQMSDPEEDCAHAQLTSTGVTESSLESQEENTKITVMPANQPMLKLDGKRETVERKRKTPSSNDMKESKKCKSSADPESHPVFKGMKCKKDFVDAPDSEPSSTNVRTVELVLFGSTPQEKCVLIGSRRGHISSTTRLSNAAQMAPEVLSVNLSPLKRKAHVPTAAYSVKQRIREKWRRSFPPTKIRQRSKPKTQNCISASLSGVNLKKFETIGPTNTIDLPVSSETRIWNKNTKRSLNLKKRRSLSNEVKIREEKTKKDPVRHKQPADKERSDADRRRYTVMSLQEKNVLRFSVLPSNFNFKYGSSGRKETSDPVPDMSDLVEEKDKNPSKDVMRPRGTWYKSPEKKYCPLRSPPVPKTSILFQEFQKKYMEKTQPFMDK